MERTRLVRFVGVAVAGLSAVAMRVDAAKPKAGAAADFGPNVFVFDPGMPRERMQAAIDRVYAGQEHAEFGAGRYAFMFKPGEYHLDVPVGFYTEVLGLGATPDAVHITGNVHADASLPKNNATCTFWRAAEGFSVTPTAGPLQWATSQAVVFRRMHVMGDMVLHQKHGWASGGWMADTAVDGNVDSGTQQQWIARNTEWKSWTGSNWNQVFVGDPAAPVGSWPKPAFTEVASTPVVREKPFLQLDRAGDMEVRVPALVRNSAGVTWHGGDTAGRSIPLGRFYLARPGVDTADTVNAALRRGKDVIFLPGIFELSAPIRVERAGTVVLGLGFATLRPVAGTAAMLVGDAPDITVAGLLFDAGEKASPMLMQVGMEGRHMPHPDRPIALFDLFFRVGGAGPGKTEDNLVIDADSTIVDHTWIWRADHGAGVGWTVNTSDNGLRVLGDDVTAYGLFVEHHQQFQVLWQGERGRTYFYQSEIPYDPPTQAAWSSAPGVDGWASYKVADTVKRHEAFGLGIYSVFRQPDVELSRAIEVPETSGVRLEHMVTVALDNRGQITHVVNGTGEAATTSPRTTPRVTSFP